MNYVITELKYKFVNFDIYKIKISKQIDNNFYCYLINKCFLFITKFNISNNFKLKFKLNQKKSKNYNIIYYLKYIKII